jgi:hypothetical protein
MKTSGRIFLKTAAIEMGSVTLAGFGAVKAEATQLDQIKTWDYEAGVVVLRWGTGIHPELGLSGHR